MGTIMLESIVCTICMVAPWILYYAIAHFSGKDAVGFPWWFIPWDIVVGAILLARIIKHCSSNNNTDQTSNNNDQTSNNIDQPSDNTEYSDAKFDSNIELTDQSVPNTFYTNQPQYIYPTSCHPHYISTMQYRPYTPTYITPELQTVYQKYAVKQ